MLTYTLALTLTHAEGERERDKITKILGLNDVGEFLFSIYRARCVRQLIGDHLNARLGRRRTAVKPDSGGNNIVWFWLSERF